MNNYYPKLGDAVRQPKGTQIVYPIDPKDRTSMQALAGRLQSAAHSCGAKITTTAFLGRATQSTANTQAQDFLLMTVVKAGRARQQVGRKAAS